MTLREAYEALLFEQNKEEAPAILRDKFVYMFNKALNAYCNVKYNFYESKQQLDDDMEFMLGKLSLSTGAVDFASYADQYVEGVLIRPTKEGFMLQLPEDYRHLTKLEIEYEETGLEGHCDEGINKYYTMASRRLAPGMEGSIQISNNAYLKPSNRNTYHYFRASDSSKSPWLVVKYGGNQNNYKPYTVGIDYLKTLPKLVLTPEQLESVEDTSEELPFNDRIAYEVINKLVAMVMENTEDQRLQTHMGLNTTINEKPLQ